MHREYLRDNNKAFEYEGNPLEVTSLKIWHCKYKTLKGLEEFHNLTNLVIAGFPEDSVELIANLKKLEYLQIIHLPKVSDIDPLSQLENLESLVISTLPSWDASRKKTEVKSLAPIATLPKLKYLELHGIVNPTKKLDELMSCKGLQSAMFSQFPKSEIDRFYKESNVQKQRIPTISA